MAIINGTSWSDNLVGGVGNDTLYGGAGNDLLDGGLGNDTYVFNLGDGQDIISSFDMTVGKLDVVQFGDGVLPANITITRSPNNKDLLITINGTTDTLTISNYFMVISAGSSYWDPASGTYLIATQDMRPYAIEEFRFADGASWSMAQLDALPFNGTAGTDFLEGSSGNDVLNGLAGDDYLSGNSGNDTLDGGTGNDWLDGGWGNDTYLFDIGRGQDTIKNYDSTVGKLDVVQFGPGVLPTGVTVTCGGWSGRDLVLSINGTTDTLTISDYFTVTPAGSQYWDPATGTFLTATQDMRLMAVEEIHFADGTIWTRAQLDALPIVGITINGTSGADMLTGTFGNDAINGLAGDDQLVGNDGNDTLDGGAGNDTLDGGLGNDTYLFDIGSGQDTIYDNDEGAGSLDVVQFGPGVLPADVTVTRGGWDGNALVLSINGTTDSLTIQYYFGVSNTYVGTDPVTGMPIYQEVRACAVEQIRFADGTIWTMAQLDASLSTINGTAGDDYLQGSTTNDVLNGLAGNDQLIGNDGNDTLDGGAGNDVLAGVMGNDTYLFDVGGGQDVIYDFDWTGGSLDVVQFGAGVLPANVTAARSTMNSNDLVLSINGTTDTLTIAGYFAVHSVYMGDDPATGMPIYQDVRENTVEEVRFADGTVWTQAQLDVINGTAGDDYLQGSMGNDVMNGLAGNDALDGGAGNDILRGGDGNDSLSDMAGANLLDGGAGADTLFGNGGNEMLVGGAGDDFIYTGDGADILAFNRGDGMDVVNGGIGSDNTISLGGGISYADLALSKVNNDLILEVGNGDQITLANWYDTAANYKSVIDLQVMADAMAGFDPASGDPLMNQAVQNFDFTAIVNAFDQAHGGSATYMHWSATTELLAAHLSGSDTMALGGDLAHQYGTNGSFTGMNLAAAQTALNDPQFGGAQTLNALQGLQGGAVTL